MQIIENEYITELRSETHYKQCEITLNGEETLSEHITLERCIVNLEKDIRWDFRDMHFIACDLSSIILHDAHLLRVTFQDCKLMSAHFDTCFISSVSFRNCMAQYFSISESKLRNVSFERCDLRNALLIRADYKLLKYDACTLDGASFEETRLKGLDLRDSDFSYILYTRHLVGGLKIREDQAISFVIQMGIDVS